jgi:hypothetical protein
LVSKNGKFDSGLYRVRDTNGDDQLDTVDLLHALEGGGDHGWHALLRGPDGKLLCVVAGDATVRPKLAASRVPLIWGEDHLLPRLPDARGFMTTTLAPGGCFYRVDPEGKNWELISVGYRNTYDAAFNRDGELFTFDADMEWDMNTPWYRPPDPSLPGDQRQRVWLAQRLRQMAAVLPRQPAAGPRGRSGLAGRDDLWQRRQVPGALPGSVVSPRSEVNRAREGVADAGGAADRAAQG